MSKIRAFGLISLSLILIFITSLFLIFWDVSGLAEKLRPSSVALVSWAVRILIVVACAASLASLFWGLFENRRSKNKKLLMRAVANILALLIFVLLIAFFSTDHSGKNDYAPPKNATYLHEDVRIQLPCGDILAGSLTFPEQALGKFPAVVLITGSSPHDRDNSSPEASSRAYRPFRQIADRLSSKGIAVLRMDDRGVGESVGGDIRDMTTDERAKDIEECIGYLRGRPEIDGSRIGLIGLSEGVSISHMIAAHDALIKVLVFLSGIGSPGKEILDYQIQQGVLTQEELTRFLREDRNTRFLYDYDPLGTVGQIRQPVLIIHGKKDRSVPYRDAYKLAEALKLNGNSKVTVRVLEGYDHTLLKVDQKGRIHSAKIPDEVLTIIADWLGKEI
jgi:dipeptidyl aminopeptidase/acylaminoacyl peptidase